MTQEPTTRSEIDPGNYIEKVCLATGEVIGEPVLPKQLLVQNHRDYHVVDVYARYLMSQIVGATGNEELARQVMKEVRKFGHTAGDWLAKTMGLNADTVKERLFGLKDREYFFRYKRHVHSAPQLADVIARLKQEAAQQLTSADSVRVLLTGGTGFVGKEIMWQAAAESTVAEVAVVLRPKAIRDRKTKAVIRTLSPAERGELLLDQLWITDPKQRSRFRFIAGDIEQPNLGIADHEMATLRNTVTHVIHCAASVAFDDPYEKSFSANVTGCINALSFSYALQQSPGSPFVAHLAVETTYIHGRQVRDVAREDEVIFPRNFYNNYYELTKAMGSIETERFMLEKGLRVVQLCPSIVIGESRAGNNRGDMKVVNAPVNALGWAHEALNDKDQGFVDRSKALLLAKMAAVFPGDPTAELNIITVDRVAQGVIAALSKPAATGERIHLATDNRLTSGRIVELVKDELGVDASLTEPTIHRNVRLPIVSGLMERFGQARLAKILEKLSTVFGGYSEWGQPVHEVGNDVTLLGLSEQRPNTEHAFRMLCRHNRYVQHYGKIRDDDEISRREKVWWDFIVAVETLTGDHAGAMPPLEFKTVLEVTVDLNKFVKKGNQAS